jgi:hypothetical protein
LLPAASAAKQATEVAPSGKVDVPSTSVIKPPTWARQDTVAPTLSAGTRLGQEEGGAAFRPAGTVPVTGVGPLSARVGGEVSGARG